MIPLPYEPRTAKRPIVTWTLIAVNFLVFLYFYLQGPIAFERAIRELGMMPYYILRGERLYTLITSMFMHGGWAHIGGFIAGWAMTLPVSRFAKKRVKVVYYRGRIWYEIPVE